MRLGYAAINTELRAKGIFTNRTARLATIQSKGVKFAIELATRNLQDLMEILKYNEKRGIRLFRMSSSIFPHITNSALTGPKYTDLAYSIRTLIPILKKIGEYANSHKHRLTFHPDPFISMASPDAGVRLRNKRELAFHAKILDLMNLGPESVIVIHGGGMYLATELKSVVMNRWLKVWNSYPDSIRKRLVLENDEFTYSIDDIMWLSSRAKPSSASTGKFKIPILLDTFHYECHQDTLDKAGKPLQTPIQDILADIRSSWKTIPKFHVAQQAPGVRKGTHADYVDSIPDLGLPADVMVEAKMKEQATLKLCAKYKKLIFYKHNT